MNSLTSTLFATLLLGTAVTAGSTDHQAVIDWSEWDRILQTHVADGVVDYDAIGIDAAYDRIVSDIAAASLDGEKPEAILAFYINTYNVLAVRGILDGHSPRSSLGKLRFFHRDKYTVAGETLTLDKLEHQRIRPIGEPRIHFAIVCAAASCPPLRSEAYVPVVLGDQLDDNARRFLGDPAKNRLDPDTDTAYLSKIFKWFEEDFQSSGGVQPFIARYVDDREVAGRLRDGGFRIRHLPYDWSLNGTFGASSP